MRYTSLRRWRNPALTALCGLAAAASAGCANKYDDMKVFMRAHENEVAGTIYRLEPPDVIVINSPTCPEVDNEVQRIRADGKISLDLLGEVYVAGMSPAEIAAKLQEQLARYYENPRVDVRVAAYESKSVYVFGQVAVPGPHPFTGRDTLMDVLARARPTFIAWGAQVKVIRPSARPDERREITVDVDRIVETGDMRDNLLLQEGDIVYVPPTPLGWVGLRVNEVLFPVSPMLSAYQMPYHFRDSTDHYRYGSYYHYKHDDDDNKGGYRRLLFR